MREVDRRAIYPLEVDDTDPGTGFDKKVFSFLPANFLLTWGAQTAEKSYPSALVDPAAFPDCRVPIE